MLRERFEDIAQRVPHMMRRSPAARCADLLIARYRLFRVAIFDVRALPTPPLAAERMIRLLDRKRSYLTEKGLFSRKAPGGDLVERFQILNILYEDVR